MKKLKAVLAVGALCLFGWVSADATPYEDFQLFGPEPILSGTTYGGSFDIIGAGYDPQNESLGSATVTFQVENNGELFSFVIKLASDLLGNISVSQPAITADIEGSPIGGAWDTLRDTGMLTFSIENTGSQTLFLKSALLKVESVSGSGNSVPDVGATLTLIGISALCMGFARRKMVA